MRMFKAAAQLAKQAMQTKFAQEAIHTLKEVWVAVKPVVLGILLAKGAEAAQQHSAAKAAPTPPPPAPRNSRGSRAYLYSV